MKRAFSPTVALVDSLTQVYGIIHDPMDSLDCIESRETAVPDRKRRALVPVQHTLDAFLSDNYLSSPPRMSTPRPIDTFASAQTSASAASSEIPPQNTPSSPLLTGQTSMDAFLTRRPRTSSGYDKP